MNKEKLKEKKFLYIGLLFLYSALLSKIFVGTKLSLTFLFIAIFFKLLFAGTQIKKGKYKIGYEIILLIVGLTLFLSGLYANMPDFINSRWWLMAPGLALKISFLIIFIIKVGRLKKEK